MFNNERSYTSTPPLRLHGVYRDNVTPFFLTVTYDVGQNLLVASYITNVNNGF